MRRSFVGKVVDTETRKVQRVFNSECWSCTAVFVGTLQRVSNLPTLGVCELSLRGTRRLSIQLTFESAIITFFIGS
jgi:hypothetical protein